MFWIRRQKESRRCKSMSAWFPPRLGSFTTPNIASYMEFHRSADFAASVQDLSQKLGSNAFQKQMIQVEKFESLWGYFSNGHMRADAMAFLPLLTKHSSTRPYLPVGKSKSIKGNLPRLKLYRPISVRALGVRHSIHFGILLLHDTRCSRSGRPGSLFATGLRRSRRSPAG